MMPGMREPSDKSNGTDSTSEFKSQNPDRKGSRSPGQGRRHRKNCRHSCKQHNAIQDDQSQKIAKENTTPHPTTEKNDNHNHDLPIDASKQPRSSIATSAESNPISGEKRQGHGRGHCRTHAPCPRHNPVDVKLSDDALQKLTDLYDTRFKTLTDLQQSQSQSPSKPISGEHRQGHGRGHCQTHGPCPRNNRVHASLYDNALRELERMFKTRVDMLTQQQEFQIQFDKQTDSKLEILSQECDQAKRKIQAQDKIILDLQHQLDQVRFKLQVNVDYLAGLIDTNQRKAEKTTTSETNAVGEHALGHGPLKREQDNEGESTDEIRECLREDHVSVNLGVDARCLLQSRYEESLTMLKNLQAFQGSFDKETMSKLQEHSKADDQKDEIGQTKRRMNQIMDNLNKNIKVLKWAINKTESLGRIVNAASHDSNDAEEEKLEGERKLDETLLQQTITDLNATLTDPMNTAALMDDGDDDGTTSETRNDENEQGVKHVQEQVQGQDQCQDQVQGQGQGQGQGQDKEEEVVESNCIDYYLDSWVFVEDEDEETKKELVNEMDESQDIDEAANQLLAPKK